MRQTKAASVCWSMFFLTGLLASRCNAQAMRIVSKTITAGPVYQEAVTHVSIVVKREGNLDGSFGRQVNLQITQDGFIHSVNGKDLVTNRAGSIGALNFSAATKTNDVYLIIARHGQILLITDFNDRLIALCRKEHRPIDQFDIAVENINGNTLQVVSTSYPKVEYDLKVCVTALGKLSILSYQSLDTM